MIALQQGQLLLVYLGVLLMTIILAQNPTELNTQPYLLARAVALCLKLSLISHVLLPLVLQLK